MNQILREASLLSESEHWERVAGKALQRVEQLEKELAFMGGRVDDEGNLYVDMKKYHAAYLLRSFKDKVEHIRKLAYNLLDTLPDEKVARESDVRAMIWALLDRCNSIDNDTSKKV